ncbi:6465_t:CDS:2 [Paraglomus brasilianum]|uniref:6465_t:CDS:1 n=1 Tax=Paraglomus brasilianum TaxID=144538 RepID=A0A9N8Z0C5_9GLOM|nr:6465_t:CDS:2 [Paraglomus brasilianum]
MQLELPIITFDTKTFLDIVIDSDNETSAAERDIFTYEPRQYPPLSEPEYQETSNHGNVVEENANEKESDINEECRELFRRSDQEIAEWVTSRPHILNLIKILEKKPTIDQSTLNDRIYKESRALFLRTRNSTSELYEEFAARLLGSTRAHPDVPMVAKKVGDILSNMRCQVNILLKGAAKNYIDKYGNDLTDRNLHEFVDDHVWRHILRLPLMGVNEMILNNDKHITFKLREFVMRAVERWVVGREPKKAIRELDHITIDLAIQSNYNIAAKLPVKQLLLCQRSRRHHS